MTLTTTTSIWRIEPSILPDPRVYGHADGKAGPAGPGPANCCISQSDCCVSWFFVVFFYVGWGAFNRPRCVTSRQPSTRQHVESGAV